MQNRLLVNSTKSWLQEHKSVPCSLYIYYKKERNCKEIQASFLTSKQRALNNLLLIAIMLKANHLFP